MCDVCPTYLAGIHKRLRRLAPRQGGELGGDDGPRVGVAHELPQVLLAQLKAVDLRRPSASLMEKVCQAA